MDGARTQGPAEGQAPLRTAVIVASTREGRLGGDIAAWVARVLESRPEFTPELVDLAAFDFPSRYPAEPTPEVIRFTAALERAEGFVVVTPEYNRSYPASLKQAVDFGYDEWRAKPVGFTSYGSGDTGVHAVEHLRTVFVELQAVTVRNRVGVDVLTEDPARLDGPRTERAATAMLDQLLWWGLALREARARRPYQEWPR